MTKATFESLKITPESIKSVTVLKKEEAALKYKLTGIDGIVEIEIKE